MKRVLTWLLVVTIVLGLFFAMSNFVGCKSTAAGEGEKKIEEIGVSHYLAAYEFFAKVQAGIDEVANAKGIKVSSQDANLDAAKQLQQIETFINAGVDGIISSTIDGTVLNPAVKKAVDAGIGFISLYVPVEDATVNYVVDEYKYGLLIGTLAGQWAQKNFPGEKIQAALLRMHDYVPGIERGRGEREAFLKEFPTGEIVADQNAVDVDSAMKATEAILQANPDVRIFITDSDDTGAIGAYEVLKAKVDPADYYKYGVFGADGVNQAIKYVKENGMYRATVDVHPEKVGATSVNMLIDWAAGKDIPNIAYSEFKAVDYDTAMKEY